MKKLIFLLLLSALACTDQEMNPTKVQTLSYFEYDTNPNSLLECVWKNWDVSMTWTGYPSAPHFQNPIATHVYFTNDHATASKNYNVVITFTNNNAFSVVFYKDGSYYSVISPGSYVSFSYVNNNACTSELMSADISFTWSARPASGNSVCTILLTSSVNTSHTINGNASISFVP